VAPVSATPEAAPVSATREAAPVSATRAAPVAAARTRQPAARGGDNREMDALGGIFLLAGRVLFSSLFVFSAWGHMRRHPQYVGIARGKLPIAFLAGVPTGAYLLLASLSLVAGIWADVGALMIAAFLAPAALLFHPFWKFSDPAARRTQQGSFFRNVTLFGAALALFALFGAAGHVPFAVTGPAIDLR